MRGERVGWRRWLARLAPGVVVGTVGMVAVAVGVPVVGLLSLVGLVVLTPWGRSLAARVMVALLVSLAAAEVALEVPALRWGTATIVMLLAGQTLMHAGVASLRQRVPLVPRVPADDGVALLGSGLLVAMLAAPYVGRSTDDVLLELARGFDTVNHVLAVANLVVEHGSSWAQPGWPSPDGSPVEMAGYPLGFHATVAGLLQLWGVAPTRDVVVPYAWTTVLALGVCAAVLTWVAVRVARTLGPPETARARGIWAGVGYSACLLLSGMFVAPFVLGHAPFIVAATAGIATSWLALALLGGGSRPAQRAASERDTSLPRSGFRREAVAMGVLALGALGLVGAYPPLTAGLVPATLAWVWHWTDLRQRQWLRPVAIAAMSGGLLAALWLWRGRLDHLVLAMGENSTPLLISTILVVLTAGLAWVCWERGWGLAPVRALAVSAGYFAAAVVLAVAARTHGLSAADSYYGTKVAEAAWLGASPVLVAMLSAALVRLSTGASRITRVAVPFAGILGLAVLIGALPIGRSQALFVGPGTLGQRMLEARRAHGEVQVVEAARLAGPSTGDASAMIDPAGWFYPVAREDAPAPQWRREAVTAGLWMATLRGLRTEATDEAAACFRRRGGIESLSCLERWLSVARGRRITLVVGSGPAEPVVRAWARSRGDQVRVLVLAPPHANATTQARQGPLPGG